MVLYFIVTHTACYYCQLLFLMHMHCLLISPLSISIPTEFSYLALLLQGHTRPNCERHLHILVRHIGLETVRHRLLHGPSTAADCLSVRGALRRICVDYHLLGPRAADGDGDSTYRSRTDTLTPLAYCYCVCMVLIVLQIHIHIATHTHIPSVCNTTNSQRREEHGASRRDLQTGIWIFWRK